MKDWNRVYAGFLDDICNIERANEMTLDALSKKDIGRAAELQAAWCFTLEGLKDYFKARLSENQ